MFIYDFFLNNFYIIIPLIILPVFLAYCIKFVLGIVNTPELPYGWRDRLGGFGSGGGGIGSGSGISEGGGFGHFGDGGHGCGGGGGGVGGCH